MSTEDLDRFVDMEFHLNACIQGHRYLVSNHVDVQMDLDDARPAMDFRRHFDAVLVKHSARFAGGAVNFVSFFDTSFTLPEKVVPVQIVSNKHISYYHDEVKPWWKVALRHPFKIDMWLFLRKTQKQRRSRKA